MEAEEIAYEGIKQEQDPKKEREVTQREDLHLCWGSCDDCSQLTVTNDARL